MLFIYLESFSLFCSEQLRKPDSPCGKSLSRMDFSYGKKSDFPGCFLPINLIKLLKIIFAPEPARKGFLELFLVFLYVHNLFKMKTLIFAKFK